MMCDYILFVWQKKNEKKIWFFFLRLFVVCLFVSLCIYICDHHHHHFHFISFFFTLFELNLEFIHSVIHSVCMYVCLGLFSVHIYIRIIIVLYIWTIKRSKDRTIDRLNNKIKVWMNFVNILCIFHFFFLVCELSEFCVKENWIFVVVVV